MRPVILSFACGFVLTSLAPLFAQAQSVKLSDIRRADTASELLALGATKLTAAQFRERVVDKALNAGEWAFWIYSDGTYYVSEEGVWRMKGDEHCLGDGDELCRDTYMIGSYVRFGKGEELLEGTFKAE